MFRGIHFLFVLTLCCFVRCELSLEDVYQEVLTLRSVVNSMEKKLQLQDVRMEELNGIIRRQQYHLNEVDQDKVGGSPENLVFNKESESESINEGDVGIDLDSGLAPSSIATHPKLKNRKIEKGNDKTVVVHGNYGHQREGRLLTETVPDVTTSGVVAFYTYLSTVLAHTDLGQDRTIKFDVVKTNEGHGYHPGSGVFIAPETGFYVFVWTIRVGAYNKALEYHSTELLINNAIYGSVYALAFPDSSKDDSGTGTVVAHVNKGDDVYIRTHSTHNGSGGILSEGFGRSSFAGWKIN